ncbi:MAG TPA: prohibitin family protein [Bacteroidetes bacterium]|nr:prohibitin family protein [Bacteroidota bacterium]
MKNTRFAVSGVIALVLLILVIALSSSMFVTIDAGHKGVLFRKFGGGLDLEQVYGQGFQVIAPWNSMYVYDVRIQEQMEEMDVLAENGLNIHIDLSFRFRAIPERIADLHDEIGRDYAEKIVIPEIRAATRKVIGEYLPEELYSTKREAIQTEIFEATQKNLTPKHLYLDAVLIRSVTLPNTIKEAIEHKLEQQQQRDEYEFRIQKEIKEAERKKIEAQGIKGFQDIVSDGISERYLKWKGIEATLELSESPNSKTIIIGGSDGLPIILGNN